MLLNEIGRHKVFISFYSGDSWYKDELLRLNDRDHLFEDYSVGQGDIPDDLSDEQIRIRIRDEFIKDSTVLILLCGRETKKRKFIDWELHAAMYDSEKNPKTGILVINLPNNGNGCRANSDKEKEIVSPIGTWTSLDTIEEYHKNYPSMPERLIQNFYKKVPITVIDWARAIGNTENLKILIDEAFKRRKDNDYDIHEPLRRRNS